MANEKKQNKRTNLQLESPGDLDELSASDYPYGPVAEGFEPRTTPGPVARGLSKALMQGAFQKFGQAFTDTGDVRRDIATRESRLAPFIQAGGEVASALEGRWHQMEYENFQSEFIEPFIAKKRAMLDDYTNRHAMADEGVFEGPDGQPVELDITNKEDRMKAIRMRGQLEKKFYAINGDMDLELFNEAGKYSNNPMIVQRANMIQQSTTNHLATITSPMDTLGGEDVISQIRSREEQAEIGRMQARATAAAAKDRKRPQSYAEAIKDPDVGAGGIMQWFVSSPEGLSVLHAPGGGASFVNAEREIAKSTLMKQNPDMKEGMPELDAKLNRLEPQYVARAAGKYLEHLDPGNFDLAKQLTPHFFDLTVKPLERGIVSDRQDPKVREQNVNQWETAAENHFNAYMQNPDTDPNIDAALEDLEAWLRAAVYGDTEEPALQAITAARGEGTRKYVEEILEEVPAHIRRWWASKKGSGIAQEQNPEAARRARALSGKMGRRAYRGAAGQAALLERRKKEGLL